jgi:hypothetical protein
MWEEGFACYAEHRPLAAIEKELAKVLDWTGIVVGAGLVLRWLGSGRLADEHLPGATRRLEQLVRRMEGWQNSPGVGSPGLVIG